MGLYNQFQTALIFATLIPLIQIMYISLERSYKAPVLKDSLKTI